MTRVLDLGYEVSDYLLRTDVRPTLSLERTFARDSRRELGSQKQADFGIGLDSSFDGDGVGFSYIAIDGPAAVAGLRVGDVLLELNGHAISSRERASILIRHHRTGEMVEAKVRCQGQILQIKVRLSNWP
jgi:S1-C subfamily serine protease